jgi:hypothetical protein
MSLHDTCSVHDPCDAGAPEVCPREPIRLRRQRDKQGAWGQLIVKKEPGGLRHYLDGKPVRCGSGLVLQHRGTKTDDYGEYSVPLQQGTAVRYEASQDSKELEATLYVLVGENEFTASLQPWMRFRWTKDRR